MEGERHLAPVGSFFISRPVELPGTFTLTISTYIHDF